MGKWDDLSIIKYPDPRLKKVAKGVETIDQSIKELVARMFELMREAKGVGLAAPQTGTLVRVFVMNHSGNPEDDRVYINPVLSEAEGEETQEEGCLSLPEIHVDIVRSKKLRMQAKDLEGRDVDQTESGYIARIWQHETDHLNGTLLTDRMGPTALMTHKRILRGLEEDYAKAHPKAQLGKTGKGR